MRTLPWHTIIQANSVCRLQFTCILWLIQAIALEGFSEALSKEIPEDWNIHVVIVQPGGFRTDWNKGSMQTVPPHPAYAGSDTPSSKYRPLHNLTFIGDPVKGEASFKHHNNVPEV